MHFDPVTRRPQEDLKCVMPEGKAARQWIREYTSSRGRSGNSPLLSDAGLAVANSSFGVGTWCSTFGSPESGVTWMCEGIECGGSVQLRAPDGRTKHRGGRTAAASGGGFGGTFYCTGAGLGCFLLVTDYGDGTAEIYFGGSCAAEGGGDGGSGSGSGSGSGGTPQGEGIDSTLAPANPLAFCPIEMQPDPPLDQQPPSPPIETCTSESCMRNSPGVWVGSIAVSVQVFSNFRHTAIAVVRLDSSVRVTELMGWTESTTNVIRTGLTPYMDGFEGYSWVLSAMQVTLGRPRRPLPTQQTRIKAVFTPCHQIGLRQPFFAALDLPYDRRLEST